MKIGKNELAEKPSPVGACASVHQRISSPAFISLLLATVTLAVYWTLTQHEFVNLDDQTYVTENSHVLGGINLPNTIWAFTNLEAGFWHPLTWLSHMLDCQIYGLRSGGHHFTSLLLHVANTVLLFISLRRMTAATWRSAFVAALFALHPLHVESVAWAADRKDVLSTFFALLALWAYVRYAQIHAKPKGRDSEEAFSIQYSVFSRGKSVWYFAALALFACAVMSKTMVVTLPLVLLLLDFWPLRRFELNTEHFKLKTARPLLLEKIPFLLISFLAGVLTVHAERTLGALATVSGFPLNFRLANAILSCWKYVGQICWPVDLAVFYPYPRGFSLMSVVVGALLLVLVSVLILRAARTRSYLAVGWFWYLLTLLPVSGLIQVGAHVRADRYTYVPLIGVFIMLAWGAHDLARRWRKQAAVLALAGVLTLVLCTAFTRRQVSFWRNSETLFRHALQVTADNSVAYYCLGVYLSDHGQIEQATKDYELALQIDPAYGEAHNDLGIEIAKRGDLNRAIAHFHKAILSEPRLAGPHGNLGLALALQHNSAGAAAEFQESLRLKPHDAPMHKNLGDVLADQGRFSEAIVHYREALKLGLNGPQIRFNLGMALAMDGQREKAAAELAEALRLKPDYAEARRELQRLGAPNP